ncbi:MAG: endo-beta-N-acetylglucosaminidase [Culicoidibacterales bacterium]
MNKKIGVSFACIFGATTLLSACTTGTATQTNQTFQVTEEGTTLKMSNQPLAPHWYPDELLEWDPTTAETTAFNVSSQPLIPRVDKAALPLLHDKQNHDTNLVAISMMNTSTSGNPAQGSTSFRSNTFSYWQYVDKLVYWGGSAGEGIIVPPSADVIDVAHKNGVPVLGTIFFPMTVHGGKMEWLDLFLEQDANGDFPIIPKLIEVAETYGFEGWFINQETESTDEAPLTAEHAKKMQAFIKAFKAASPSLEIMWYDSMTESGEMDWQNALTAENQFFLMDENKEQIADSMFLNFWWTTDKLAPEKLLEQTNTLATQIGFDPYELYAGIDVQAEGFSTPVKWELFEKGNTTQTSLGLYSPSWSYASSESPDDFEMKENRFWVNEFQNPALLTETTGTQWRGISTYVAERSVLTQFPFQTHFNVGNGYNYFIDGEQVSLLDWNNRSLADVLPTYRWLWTHEGANNLGVSIDYANAFYGGNSLKVTGNLEANMPSYWTLYSAQAAIPESALASISLQSNNPITVDLVLTFADGETATITGETITESWSTLTYDLSPYSGKTLATVSLKVSADTEVNKLSFNLGKLALTTDAKVPTLDMSAITITDQLFEEDDMFAGVTLDFEPVADAKLYEVYRENPDGSLSFLGATPNDIFFVNALQRAETGNETQFAVYALNANYERGEKQVTTLTWPDNTLPKANFKASQTLVAPGETVTFSNLSSQTSTEFSWLLPGSDVETSTDTEPTVTYSTPGTYPVTLISKNEKGEDTREIIDLITVDPAAATITSVSAGKTATASSFIHDGEAPQFVLDGDLSTKWCAVGPAPHDITIDLGAETLISEVYMAHAEAGGEGPDMNTQSYTIETSLDGVAFAPIVEVKKNTAAETTDTFAAHRARYVKITINKPTQGADSAVRIYSIDVNGIAN